MQARPLGQEETLKKEMATHSSILAWKIPSIEEPWWATVHGIAEMDISEASEWSTHTECHKWQRLKGRRSSFSLTPLSLVWGGCSSKSSQTYRPCLVARLLQGCCAHTCGSQWHAARPTPQEGQRQERRALPWRHDPTVSAPFLLLPRCLSWCSIFLQCGRPRFDPWVEKIPCRRERLPTPLFWPGESQDSISMGVTKSRTQLGNFHFTPLTSQGHT